MAYKVRLNGRTVRSLAAAFRITHGGKVWRQHESCTPRRCMKCKRLIYCGEDYRDVGDDLFLCTTGKTCKKARRGRLRKYYCSVACYWRFRRHWEAVERRLDQPEKNCICCGKVFKLKRSDAVTCSSRCRQKMYRHRHAGDLIAPD
jgi:hypothetical protein